MIAKAQTRSHIFSSLFSGVNLWLLGSATFSVILISYRVFLTDTITYLFLIWNLFLAAVPYMISSVLVYGKSGGTLSWKTLPFLLIWLLFSPNAPYIITDLFHLQPRQSIPEWYDLMILTSFALNGLIVGVLSLMHIHEMVANRFHAFFGWLAAFLICLASGFGVYLGRFMRWNSWDMFTNPAPLFDDLSSHLTGPFQYDRIHGMTLVMGVLLFLFYSLLKSVADSRN